MGVASLRQIVRKSKSAVDRELDLPMTDQVIAPEGLISESIGGQIECGELNPSHPVVGLGTYRERAPFPQLPAGKIRRSTGKPGRQSPPGIVEFASQ